MSRCEFREDLSAYLDRELDEVRRRRLERHLPDCPECAELLDRLQEARRLFLDDFGEAVSPGFGDRVRERLAPPAPPKRTHRPWGWAAAAALAAGLALVFLVGHRTEDPTIDPGLLAGPELYGQLAAAGHPVLSPEESPCGTPRQNENVPGLDLDLFGNGDFGRPAAGI